MQVLTWSEMNVKGGQKNQIVLPQPASQLDYYRDALVLAFPNPVGGTTQIMDWRLKANFPDQAWSCHGCESPQPPDAFTVGNGIVDPASVIDISKNMNAEGYLDWEAPIGNWTILRIGHTTTLSLVFSPPKGGIGLECDKFSSHAMDVHFNSFFNTQFLDILQPLIAKGLAGVEIDSYEAGLQNWTAEFPKEFQKNCGYDLIN